MIKSCIHPAHCRCNRCLPKHPAAGDPYVRAAMVLCGALTLGAIIALGAQIASMFAWNSL